MNTISLVGQENIQCRLKWFKFGYPHPRDPDLGPRFILKINVQRIPLPGEFEIKIDELLGAMVGIGFTNVELEEAVTRELDIKQERIDMYISMVYPDLHEMPQGVFNALLRLEERIPQLFTADEVSLVHF